MARRQKNETISGQELRARIKALGLTYAAAAQRLGLTLDGLNKQMREVTAVSRQTEIILATLEQRAAAGGEASMKYFPGE
jgi:hypothetical protein